ncbi:MAG: MMPL family transporter [Candidatus Nanopelagicales bacterium]
MPGLSAWAVRRPVVALIAWFAALLAIAGLGIGLGGQYNDSFDLPDTESKVATDLLSSSGTDTSNVDGGATVVWSPATGSAIDAAAAAEVLPVLEEIAAQGMVTCVTNPFDPRGAGIGRDCASGGGIDPAAAASVLTPEELQTLTASFSPVSPDGTVAYATISFEVDDAGAPQVDAQEAVAILDAVKGAQSDTLTIGVQGQLLEFAGQEPPSSEAIGILVAIVILLIAFGSIVAAGLPIITAMVGLAGGLLFVTFVANFLDVATFAPTLAAMIGLGVGIDYALFVINRYRQAVLIGHQPKKAAMEAVETAGRAVVFAGSAVIIGLLGLLVLGINFFTGLAIGAAMTVVMVMLSAIWFLPAVLSLMGTKALALRLPWGKKPGTGKAEGRGWAHYGRGLQRVPWLTGLVSLAFVVILAIPALSLRQGFADDSGKPEGAPARIAYDLRAEGFGPGSNGPFLVVADLEGVSDPQAYASIVAGLSQAPGVAGTSPSIETLPIIGKLAAAQADAGAGEAPSTVQAIAVYPASAPQDEATAQLLSTLRDEVNPALEQATGAQLYVGGTQAITQDFTTVLTDALPVFLAVVVGLGFVALVILFHSILVPLTGALTSLLSLGAAMGISVAVFQWGWFAELIGVTSTGPIFPFVPIMVFAILFGLSMDYQVFLVSRMQEEWMRTQDNLTSIRRGLAGSGRVVVIAALIMSSVFLAFVPSTDAIIKLFGVALASAVLIDAFVVRLVLVPSLMSIFGKANWWLPGWLDRILPTVNIEPGEDEVADDSDPDAIKQPVSV